MPIENKEVILETNASKQEQKWTYIIESFQKEFGKDIYRAWISNLNLTSLTEFEITLSVPTAFIRDWIYREYFNGKFKKINNEHICVKKGIKQILLDYFPKLVSFEIIVDRTKKQEPIEEKNEIISISKNNNLYNIGTELNKNFTFENYVVGQSNKLAFQICKNIAESSEFNSDINPLFLYGNVGLGKTHLCQAIAWTIKERNKDSQIVYLSAEKFMFLFVQALQNQNINDFKKKFRNIDTLIIDDIQFILGKDKTQKEFFYTFDTLVNEKKQIILACDRSPINLENLDEKLKSRLNGGLIIDIKEPDYQLRLDIIKKKSKDLNLILSEELMKFIAENITTNGREIEGCLKRLLINQNIMHINITKDDIKSILYDNINQTKKTITIDLIQEKVADYFNISLSDLKSEKRFKDLILARHTAMYLCKIFTTKSFQDISKKFNSKSHATVIHAVKKIESMIENDIELNNSINSISNNLK